MQAIVVAPAYRLGVFGFLYGSELELDAQSANEATGNHGFWDQRLALEWTREMAVSLGGDPSNLTISGYSAGNFPFIPTLLVYTSPLLLIQSN